MTEVFKNRTFVKNFYDTDDNIDQTKEYLKANNKDLKIIDIVRKLPYYIGRSNPHLIPRARPVWARHVLEMKANSKISKNLKVGDVLTWKSPLTLKETEEKVKAFFKKN